jgi:predicted GNAT superfamily acetyltransferase
MPTPGPSLRPITAADHAAVLELNHRNVEMLAPLDGERLSRLLSLADRADVVDVGGGFAGFVLTFGPGTPYDSENYRWFTEQYADFYYLDRIVLDASFRRRGLGAWVYDEVEKIASKHGRLVLEVSLDPPNDASLAFHAGRGFVEVAQLGAAGKRVSLMTKELP